MKHILLIHDGDVVMNALTSVLQQEGFRVTSRADFSVLEGSDAVLALVNSQMPALGARGAVADLKLQYGLNAMVYLFSSEPEEALKLRAQQSGADGYACTEWGFRRLLSVVRYAARARPVGRVIKPEEIELHTFSRVLVLDDHAGARGRLVSELCNQGYHAEGCGDPVVLEKALVVHDPDLLIADVVLETASGDEICRRLKARMSSKQIPIMLMSSLPEAELRSRAERAGADAYFRKQDGVDKLIQLIEGLLSEIVF